MGVLSRLVDMDNRRSLSARMRRKRFVLFERLLGRLPRPVRILDVGGTESFWQTMGLRDLPLAQILLLNIHPVKTSLPNFRSVRGDARDLSPFGDREFDVVFSNSVIEHLGNFDDQRRMADEVRRVGKRYFVQTPNYYFPVEPHFVFPLFQFLPEAARALLVQYFAIGPYERLPERARALAAVREFRLLSLGELKRLFPTATIYKEKLFGLTKSFVAFEGWDPPLPGRAGPESPKTRTRIPSPPRSPRVREAAPNLHVPYLAFPYFSAKARYALPIGVNRPSRTRCGNAE